MLAAIAEAGLPENLLALVQRVREIQIGHEAVAGQTGGAYPGNIYTIYIYLGLGASCR